MRLRRFTETGGVTPLADLKENVSRTRLHAGLDLSLAGNVRPWAYVRAAHDLGDRSGIAPVVFADNPALGTFEALGPHAGRASAELGAGVDARLGGNLTLGVAYEGAFRSGSRRHAARAGLSLAF